MAEGKGKVHANATAAPQTDLAFSPSENDLRGSATEPKVGELLPGEAESGGLGRHLGLWSTVALMFVSLQTLLYSPSIASFFFSFLC